jgi:hypothetical protein
MPKAGDPAKIFFTLGGTEEDSVASGQVQSVSDSSVELKNRERHRRGGERATGTQSEKTSSRRKR